MYVKDDKEMLNFLLNTTQISQISIQKILNNSMGPNIRIALQSQLREYDSIESDAHILASQRGWELHEIQPAKRLMTAITTHVKLIHRKPDKKIADLVIQLNTRGMIQNLKNQNQYQQKDSQVIFLSQRLLDCETANIKQMQNFL